MTKSELSAALKIAKSDKELHEDLSIFLGYGLKNFDKIYVTLDAVAKLIRYQCIQFDGSIDTEKLNSLAYHSRQKFMVI